MGEREGLQMTAKNQRDGGQEEGDTQGGGNQFGRPAQATGREVMHQGQRQDGGAHAACGHQADDAPVDRTPARMHDAAAGFGDGGVEQVGADGGGRVDAEQQDE